MTKTEIKIKLMSWNTELYKYGNKMNDKEAIKPIGESLYKEKFDVIKEHLQKENSVAVLQEIPYRANEYIENCHEKWTYHFIWEKFKEEFPENDYYILKNPYNSNGEDYVIKMTVILTKTDSFITIMNQNSGNLFIPFIISYGNEKSIDILGVHAHDAQELITWLKNKNYTPDLIIGDFNAGNYIKKTNDSKIAENRENYQKLSNGYIDLCQGIYTTNYKEQEQTQIDHILIKNSNEIWDVMKYENVKVDNQITLSDHYPIYCDIVLKL